jgi:vitamin B12 transport system substrate-binding protein
LNNLPSRSKPSPRGWGVPTPGSNWPRSCASAWPNCAGAIGVWNSPLYTVGGGQIISDALTVCGARNVFDDLNLPAPQVSIESVLQRNPEMILVSDQAQMDAWKAWPTMAERVRQVPDKGLERPSGQMLEALGRLCRVIAPDL